MSIASNLCEWLAKRWLAPFFMMVFLVFGLGGFSGLAHSQADPGRFEVRSASTDFRAGVCFLNALVEYRLSSDARNALDSGVTLAIQLDVEVLERRRFWLDLEDASLEQLYQLERDALSERYIVRNLNSGEQLSFATLFSALNYLGRINDLPVIDVALLDNDEQYDMRIRVGLNTEDFPGPLRFLSFMRRKWSLKSDWYRWELERS